MYCVTACAKPSTSQGHILYLVHQTAGDYVKPPGQGCGSISVNQTKSRLPRIEPDLCGKECLSKCAAECLGVFAEDLNRSGDVLKRKCGFSDLANFGEDKNGETVGKSSVV
ncbi:hypothetical protein Bbelb_074750 [Branchiostoma belcheri]|nr:hypothetical protein Bbelb_074750 [Branchiostoma belcheri]